LEPWCYALHIVRKQFFLCHAFPLGCIGNIAVQQISSITEFVVYKIVDCVPECQENSKQEKTGCLFIY